MKRTVAYILMFGVLLQYAAHAAKGGVDGVVHATAANSSQSYTSRIGDVSDGGISVIGVVRTGGRTEALVSVCRSDTARSIVSTDWLGTAVRRLDYASLAGGDSLTLYSLSMGVMRQDTAKLNSRIVIGGLDNRRYCTAFDICGSESEPFVDYCLYGGLLSPAERRMVESYYAITYGLSLDQTTPEDYVDSKGGVVWGGEANGEYPNAIAGIGYDSGSELVHLTGRSISSPHSPVISVPDTVADGMYLMWSHNGGSCRMGKGSGDELGVLRRVWSVTATGDWQATPVTVSFRVGGADNLPLPEDGEIYWLKVDGSGTAEFQEVATKSYKSVYSDAGTVTFNDVSFESSHSNFTVSSRSLTEEDLKNPFQSISVYPSPTSDGNITVSLSLWQVGCVRIRIYNAVGQMVSERQLDGAACYDYSGFLPVPGVYVVIADTGGSVSTFKVERR